MDQAAGRCGPGPCAGWWFDAVLLVAFVALTYALARGHLLGLDRQVADWADQHRPAVLYWPARVLNYLGQGGQVLMPVAVLLAGDPRRPAPLGAAGAACSLRRSC